MKSIYLLRHAKSSWKDAELSDIDRPLNKRGKSDAPMMGRYFSKKHIHPQLIISSPAKRAFKTAALVATELGYEEKNIHIDMELYGANVNELLSIIQKQEASLDRVMLVGHNPAFTLAVFFFTGESIANLPTCGLVRIDFDTKRWKLVKEGKGKLRLFEYPRSVEMLSKHKKKK
ncbi:MAG TPA: hypothetical protein DIW47_09015 [Bacteroidetes bacterium]|nr:hypothetical protein [Bacteroidota bacterium]